MILHSIDFSLRHMFISIISELVYLKCQFKRIKFKHNIPGGSFKHFFLIAEISTILILVPGHGRIFYYEGDLMRQIGGKIYSS